MQNDYRAKGVVLAGFTAAPQAEAEQFVSDLGVNYAVMADAQTTMDAWGVKKLWGSVVYLVDRDGKVLVRGIEETRAELDKRTKEG